MKRKVRYVVTSICFLFVLLFAIQEVTNVLARKDSVIKYHDIEEDEFDVLFFGSSHVINGIYPMELWNDYGIVSYNCAGHGNTLPTTYWMMQNILEQINVPKLVVIDIHLMYSENKIRPERPGIEQQHISFDWSGISKEKIGMVNYLLDDVQTKMEFILPITIYHDRWKELSKKDFEIPYGTGKGAEYRVKRTVPNDFSLISRNEMIKDDSLGKQYLCKMIEECQSRGIEVLLVNVPYPATEEQQKWANSVDLIAQEYGVNYLNFFYEDTGIDFFTDCYDENSHLNPSGARKITKYLGEYLQSEYGIPDRRGEAEYAHWNEDYKEYSEDKWEVMQNLRNDLSTYLSLLHDSNLNICLFFNGDSEMIGWATPPKLVENISDLNRFQVASDEKQDYLLILDQQNNTQIEYAGQEAVINRHTSFANITYTSRGEDEIRELYLDDSETNYLLNEDGTMTEIAIVSFDKNTGEMVDYVRFNQNQSTKVVGQ